MNYHKLLLGGMISSLSLAICAATPETRFRDFSGTCQAGSFDQLWDNSIGWNRLDITWSECEPEPGQWNDKYYQKMLEKIKNNLDHGIKMLPVLAYAPGWAASNEKQSIGNGKQRIEYVPTEKKGLYKKTTFKKEKDAWVEKPEKDVINPKIALSPEGTDGWRRFVAKVTADLRKPPYNIDYFQVWNEAHPNSGFWDSSLDIYIQQIHIPAAREIHKLGGKVVYGGWPCCGTVDGLVKLLDKHKAWDTIDIVDIHYFGENWMDFLLRAAHQRGFNQMGVWQTEIIFHSKYYAVATTYPTVLYWGLTNNWNYVDRYKLFFFAYGSPDAPKAYGYGKCLLAGKNLTPHGQALQTLGKIFGNEPITAYPQIKSQPEMKFNLTGSRLMAFKCGKKIIVSIVIDKKIKEDIEKKTTPNIRLSIPGITPDKIAKVERIGVFGETLDLTTALELSGKDSFINIPVKESEDGRYSHPMLKQENAIRPALYTIFYLK